MLEKVEYYKFINENENEKCFKIYDTIQVGFINSDGEKDIFTGKVTNICYEDKEIVLDNGDYILFLDFDNIRFICNVKE